MFRLLFWIGVWLVSNIFAFENFFIFSQNAKVLDKTKIYTLSLNDEKDIFIVNNVNIKLIIPKEKCNYEFLKNVYFINSDNSNKIYVDNYYIDYFQKGLKKICIANYYIPKQKQNILYKFIYGNLPNVIIYLKKGE